MNLKQQHNQTPPPQYTLADLEQMAGNLALTLNEQNVENEKNLSVNDKRIMYRFWLDESKETDLALMQYLDIMRKNRKLQPFIKLALRMAILETKGYIDWSDDLCDEIEEMFARIDWSR